MTDGHNALHTWSHCSGCLSIITASVLDAVNPSEVIKSRVFAPLSRALVGRGGARDVLGWTAVAQCPTLSAKYFSVSLKISICGLTNMAKSTTHPHFVSRSNGGRNENRPVWTVPSELGHRVWIRNDTRYAPTSLFQLTWSQLTHPR